MFTHITDDELLTAARRYGIKPGSLKALAFVLFDRGLDRTEVRFMLRSHKASGGSLAATIRSYHYLWSRLQDRSPG